MADARTIKVFVLSLGLAFTVALIGGLMTDLGDWYQSLVQPAWKPPDQWFGPAWTLIFLCTALSAALCWLNSADSAARMTVLRAFAANALANLAWTFLFFQQRQPSWALAELVVLWLSIVWLIVVAWKRSRLAAALLLPYLVWVAFAGTVNYGVIQLN